VAWSVADGDSTGATIDSSGHLTVPPQTFYRSPLLYPFNDQSIWNVPIGSGAVYQAYDPSNETGSIRLSNTSQFRTIGQDAMRVFQASVTDPVARWTYQARPKYLPWPYPNDPGNDFTPGHFDMPTPPNFTGLTVDGWAVLIDPTGKYFYETWHPRVTKDANGVITNVDCTFLARNDLYGTGFPNSGVFEHNGIRAAGLSLLGGLVRTAELDAGRIPHGIAMAISPKQAQAISLGPQYVWPAAHADGGAAGVYSGVIPVGSLFAIPWNVDIDRIGLKTQAGRMLARAYQEFGGYVVDTATNTQFLAMLEADMPVGYYNDLQTDKSAIAAYLSLVTNNASAAAVAGGSGFPAPVGGGGTPRVKAPRNVLNQGTVNPRKVKIVAAPVDGSPVQKVTVPVTVTEVETTAPVIRSSNAFTVREKVRLALPLLADQSVTWTITGGSDAAQFEVYDGGITGWFLRFSGNTIRQGDHSYTVQVTATDAWGNATAQTITGTVLSGNDYGNIAKNGTFDTDITHWTESPDNAGGTVSVVAGRLRMTTNGTPQQVNSSIYQRFATIPGRVYQIKGAIKAQVGLSNTAPNVYASTSPGGGAGLLNYFTGGATNFTVTFTATTPYTYVICALGAYATPTASGYVEWDDIEIYDTVDLYAPTYVSPLTLFSRGEIGSWLDGSDLSTMFDAFGNALTTGSAVGRWLSKLQWGGSLASTLGPNLVSNASFATDMSGWTGTSWAWQTPGKARKTAGDTNSLQQNFSTAVTLGKLYKVAATYGDNSGSTLSTLLAGGTQVTLVNASSNGVKNSLWASTGSSSRIQFTPTSTFNGSVTGVFVQEVLGRHAFQETAGNRPTAQTKYVDFGTAGTSLAINFGAALGANCTVAYVDAGGVHVLQNQNIASTYTLPTGGRIYQLVIVNRALIPQEITDLSNDLLARAA
jgi:hypothetical protein